MCSAGRSPLRALCVQIRDGRRETDPSAALEFDLVEDLADRPLLGEMAQFNRQILLQGLMAVLGLAL
jgi:hypothetical protein